MPSQLVDGSKIHFPRLNNFELLRLLFACQVVLVHTAEHLGLGIPAVLEHFPGVPAFFFVSGFLIYASYKNSPGIIYFKNRFLRVFPALIFVTIGGAGVALVAHGYQDLAEHAGTYAGWFLAQISIGQAYNPSLFRDIGVGVINGSLWTLTTEILFYVAIPAIVWLERHQPYAVLGFFFASFSMYVIGPLIWTQPIYRGKTFFDVLSLTPIVWGWMFLVGTLAYKRFATLARWLPYFPLALIPLAVMASLGFGDPIFAATGNHLGMLYFGCYTAVLFWLAFGIPPVRLNFDLSYGIYVWHMPIINLLLVVSYPSAVAACALTIFWAGLSWFVIEKPALQLKPKSLKPVT